MKVLEQSESWQHLPFSFSQQSDIGETRSAWSAGAFESLLCAADNSKYRCMYTLSYTDVVFNAKTDVMKRYLFVNTITLSMDIQ